MEKILLNDLENLLNKTDQKFFVMFSTTWCPDCHLMAKIVEKIEKEINGELNLNIKFIEIDAEKANLFRNDEGKWLALKVPSFHLALKDVVKHLGYEYLPQKLITDSIIEFSK